MIEDYISKKLSINKGVITFIQNRNWWIANNVWMQSTITFLYLLTLLDTFYSKLFLVQKTTTHFLQVHDFPSSTWVVSVNTQDLQLGTICSQKDIPFWIRRYQEGHWIQRKATSWFQPVHYRNRLLQHHSLWRIHNYP